MNTFDVDSLSRPSAKVENMSNARLGGKHRCQRFVVVGIAEWTGSLPTVGTYLGGGGHWDMFPQLGAHPPRSVSSRFRLLRPH